MGESEIEREREIETDREKDMRIEREREHWKGWVFHEYSNLVR